MMHRSVAGVEALGCPAFMVDRRAVRRRLFYYIACAKLGARTFQKSFAVLDSPNSRKSRPQCRQAAFCVQWTNISALSQLFRWQLWYTDVYHSCHPRIVGCAWLQSLLRYRLPPWDALPRARAHYPSSCLGCTPNGRGLMALDALSQNVFWSASCRGGPAVSFAPF